MRGTDATDCQDEVVSMNGLLAYACDVLAALLQWVDDLMDPEKS